MVQGEKQTQVIVTVLGSDRAGIVAAVATALSEANANILDISQTILQGIFTMTMLIDFSSATQEFSEVQDALETLAEELGVQITAQRKEVFDFMHRL